MQGQQFGGYQPPGGGYPPPPGYGPPPGGGGGGKSKLPLIIALVVVGVLVLGGGTVGGIAAVRAGSDDPTPTPKPKTSTSASSTSSSPSPTPSTSSSLPALPERINDRSDDPDPLSLKELYPATYKATSGNTYKRAKQRMYDQCGSVAVGAKLKARLSRGNCTQVAVATYVDRKNKTVVSVGLANLKDKSASTRVQVAVDPSNRIVFRPLDGPGASITSKSFFELANAVGHYTEWEAMTYTDRSPKRGKTHLKLLTARAEISKMLNEPLSERMANADP